MSEKVQMAFVGCGGIAHSHADGYSRLAQAGYDRFNFTAVCDTNQENAQDMAAYLKENAGMEPTVYTSIEKMLDAEDLGAVDNCTPHAYHHTTAIPTLRRGIATMVEKPCGITVKATRRMMEVAGESGAMIACAEQIRRCRGPRAVHWAVNERGIIGQPTMFSMEIFGIHPFDWDTYKMAWRGIKLLGGGGQILDGGVHFSDMMLYMFGPVEEVYCKLRVDDTPEIEAPDLGRRNIDVESGWMATLVFESGLIGHWSWNRLAEGEESKRGVYYGEKGSLTDKQDWMHAFQFGADVMLEDGQQIPWETLEEEYMAQLDEAEKQRLFPYGFDDGITNECWDFIEAVADGRDPELDATDALAAKSLSFALYESDTAGEPVSPADVEGGKISAYQDEINEYWDI